MDIEMDNMGLLSELKFEVEQQSEYMSIMGS
jgi:hypothetical protein